MIAAVVARVGRIVGFDWKSGRSVGTRQRERYRRLMVRDRTLGRSIGSHVRWRGSSGGVISFRMIAGRAWVAAG